VFALPLTLILIENAGFSPAFIYERARLRALSSKNDLDFKDLDFKDFKVEKNHPPLHVILLYILYL